MNLRFGIIADDLTGANDSGIQLKEKGLATSVYFEVPEDSGELEEAIVIDTDSRALTRSEAYDATKSAAQFLYQKGYHTIYKKMDSTIRGHIGEELKAIEDVIHPTFIVVAPAFPPYGRTTKNGVHLLHGQPISETEISKDPKHPVTTDHLPTLIKDETGREAALITEEILHADHEQWLEYLDDLKSKGVKYLVADAANEEDLTAMAERMHDYSSQIVWAGSAGLAEVLPKVLGMESSPQPQGKQRAAGPVLTVCGSLSQTTQAQVQYASRQKGVESIIVDTEEIFTDKWQNALEGYVQSCIDAFNKGQDAVLYVPSTQEVRESVKKRAADLGLDSLAVGKRVSQALGAVTKQVLEEQINLHSLVLTGGDTAKDVAKCLGATGFKLNYQLEAGIPAGELLGTERSIQVVTKAGAFGTESSIYQAMKKLKGEPNHEQKTDHRYHYG
ncbi:four-carbon acid sugar kinase family protein [Halobacillus rhizosphaerae]|uniref:four-carbon acid sugar kinase family protein n=1 Tax=Halobacillus rhizosphaerae TaxID=3064889 RepID=UPI00398A5851